MAPVILFVDDATFQQGALVAVGPMLAFHTPVAIGYFLPVFILRNRVRDVKQSRLQAI